MTESDPGARANKGTANDIITPPEVYVRKIDDTIGYGVFAARDFLEREIVEVAKVLIIEEKKKKLPSELDTYVFAWNNSPYAENRAVALALGYGSLYNHADPANLRLSSNAKAQTIIYAAARNIAKDEELTINYNAIGGGATWFQDLWFRAHGLKILGKTKA